MIKLDLSQGCKVSSIQVNQSMWYTISTNWKKKHMIISIDAEKAFVIIQHPFMIKIPQKQAQVAGLLQHNKDHIQQTTANIILNSEKLKAFPLRSGTKQRCLPIPATICQHSFGSPSHSNQRRKRNKRNPDQKRRKILTAYDMILYIGNAKDTTRKLLDLINEYHKVVEYKINTQKVLAFLYTNNEKSEREIKQSHSPLQPKE